MDSISAQGTAAATAAAARPAPEVTPRTTQDDDRANEAPAYAKSEAEATPPPKKGLGAEVDVSV
jgi:hypothetical protein